MSEKTPIKTLNGHGLVDTEARKLIADSVSIESVKQTSASSADGGTNTMTVTLTNGTKSTFNVKNGSKGSDGASGPKGDKGDTGSQGPKGDKGNDGVSPTVSILKSGKVTTIEFTDVNGTQTATINDGEDGVGGSGDSPALTVLVDGSAKNSVRSISSVNDGEELIGDGVTYAQGSGSYALGMHCATPGKHSVAFGLGNEAHGDFAMAVGQSTIARGLASYANGIGCEANGETSVAMGLANYAEGDGSVALGMYNEARGFGQCVVGYNSKIDEEEKYIFIVGNGEGNGSSEVGPGANAFTVDRQGNAWHSKMVEASGVIVRSSTEGSTKKFLLRVDDSGQLNVTEYNV